MRFSIHQPNYIPWIGYFYKIYRSDVFVLLDSVQYPRGQSFGARNRVNTSGGPVFLTVPVQIEKGTEGKVTYLDVKYADSKWATKHLKTLEANYKKAPFFSEVFPLVHDVLQGADTPLSFAETNIKIIENICQYLGLTTQLVRLSQLLPVLRQKTDLIVDIGEALKATTYVCGDGGGTEYTDEQQLADHQIKTEYTRFHHTQYPQLWTKEFVSHLSALDMLFNVGKESMALILSSNTVELTESAG